MTKKGYEDTKIPTSARLPQTIKDGIDKNIEGKDFTKKIITLYKEYEKNKNLSKLIVTNHKAKAEKHLQKFIDEVIILETFASEEKARLQHEERLKEIDKIKELQEIFEKHIKPKLDNPKADATAITLEWIGLLNSPEFAHIESSIELLAKLQKNAENQIKAKQRQQEEAEEVDEKIDEDTID